MYNNQGEIVCPMCTLLENAEKMGLDVEIYISGNGVLWIEF